VFGGVSTRLDRLVILVRNLDRAVRGYEDLGFAVTPGGEHADGVSGAPCGLLGDAGAGGRGETPHRRLGSRAVCGGVVRDVPGRTGSWAGGSPRGPASGSWSGSSGVKAVLTGTR
jgi:hypothetical protein